MPSIVFIEIGTIPHNEQRYPTIGDWRNVSRLAVAKPKDVLVVSVSAMQNPDYEFLVGLHELVEAWLCKKHGITAAQVDEFDMEHLDEEPGDNPKAPYFLEHQFAAKVEKLMAEELGVNWEEYEKHLTEVLTCQPS